MDYWGRANLKPAEVAELRMNLKNSAADPGFVSTTWTSPVPWNLLDTKNSMGVHWGCDLIWFDQCVSVTWDGICSSDLLTYKNNLETQWFLKQPRLLVYLLSVWFMLSEGGASNSSGWPHTCWQSTTSITWFSISYVFDKRSASIPSNEGLVLLLKQYFWVGLVE